MPDKKLTPTEIAANLEIVQFIPLWIERAGLTQEQFANKLRVSVGTASKWLRGLTPMSTTRLYAISKLLKVDAKLLLTDPSNSAAAEGFEAAARLLNDLSTEDRERWLKFGENLKSSQS